MESGTRTLAPEEFPLLLRELPDAPKRLYLRGALPDPERWAYLCIVGSRAASAYGRRACQSLIAGLAGQPICIVSGLALGIDAEAHKAALEAGLPTVAVLPSGADDSSIYPSINRPLAQRILKSGGGLLSEYEEGWKPQQWSFPARNRIMAGLSRATLIIEAGEKSGTLITARLALEYNRDVFAVPQPIGSASGAGNNRLIREGAALVRDADDILEALGLKRSGASGELPPDLDAHERAVLEALTEPLTRDELIARASLSAQEAGIALSSLSLRGLLTERLGKLERS